MRFAIVIILLLQVLICRIKIKRRRRYAGVILPILTFSLSIVILVESLGVIGSNYYVLRNADGTETTYETKNEVDAITDDLTGQGEKYEVEHVMPEKVASNVAVYDFIYMNIGTLLLVWIFIMYERRQRNME